MLYKSCVRFLLCLSLNSFILTQIISAQEPRVTTAGFNNCVASPEICGNGVDEDCDGIDTPCPGLDSDNDGYTNNIDCDPNDHFVYPGISVQCSANCGSGYKTCNSNGTFSSCSCNPLCEAKGAGRCFYIDPVAGNDNNAGTFQQKLKTLRRFASYSGGAVAPSNKIDLRAGDVIYLFSGVYKDQYLSDGFSYVMKLINVRGTSIAPIVFKAYPGNFPVISPTSRALGISMNSCGYISFEGLQIKEAYQMGISAFDSDHLLLSNLHVYNNDGEDNENTAGVYMTRCTDVELKNSVIHDNYDRTCADTGGNKTENSRNIVFFQGGNVKVHHNSIFQTQPTSAQKTGGCLVYKHSQTLAGGIFEVNNNSFRNCFFTAIGNGGYGGRFHHNLILNSDVGIMVKDMGGNADGRDNLVEFNTIINTEALQFNPSQFIEWNYQIGNIEFRNNIVSDNRTYSSDNGGIMTFDIYGSNSAYQATMSSGYIRSNNNCFYSSNNFEVAFFSSNYPSSRNLGGMLGFSAWKGLGFDLNSVIVNPQVSGPSFKSNASDCLGKGYLQ